MEYESALTAKLRSAGSKAIRTLYQCFFTLPSVLAGKVFAISLQLLPASRSVLSRCSSAGVQGVLVLPFFAMTGLGKVPMFRSPTSLAPTEDPEKGPTPGCAKALILLPDEPGGSPISETRRFREFVGDGNCDTCC
jgi:hypothetical protein